MVPTRDKKNWFKETTLHADKLKVDYILDLSHYY